MNTNDPDSFGDLLHAFRKRARFTQQQLAEAVGMHRHAISRWEQGSVLPASKTIVLELARSLHLTDQESRQLLDASMAAPIPLWACLSLLTPFLPGVKQSCSASTSFCHRDRARPLAARAR